jgi:autotransporter-associated beta strand protein
MAVTAASTVDAHEAFTRWSTTSRGNFGSTYGTPVELTWSIVADGTAIGASSDRHAAGTSNLIATYGLSTIESRLTTVYGRLSAISGLSFFRELNDSGSFAGSPGQTGVRGDLRIAGINFFGSTNVIAYNYYPSGGDMVYNTNEGLSTSVLYHEIFHGLGVAHVSASSTRSSSLMLPSIDGAPGSPAFDDILALHYLYGDVHEKSGGTNQGNGAPARATSLGALSVGSTVSIGTSVSDLSPTVGSSDIDFVTISRASDVDFFKFTLSAPVDLSGILDPKGPTYLTGPEGGSATSFNAKAQNDLTLTIYGTDGTTVLGTYNSAGLGGAESFQEMFLTAPGDYYARVTGTSNNAQMYRLDVSAAAHPWFWDNDGANIGFGTASGTWAAETVGNSTQGWVMNSEGTTVPGNVTTSTAVPVYFGTSTRGLAAGTINVSGTVQSGNLNFGAASGHIQLSGGAINLSDAATIRVDNAINTIQSVVTGAATSLTKTGNGTVVLAGGNAGPGGGTLVLQAGTLRLGAHDAITTGRTLVIPNGSTGQLDLNGFNQTLGGMTSLWEDGTNISIAIAGGASSNLTINATAAASFGPGGVLLTQNANRTYTLDLTGIGGFAWNGANQTFRVGLRPGTSDPGGASTGNFTVLLADSSSITASTITLGDVVASQHGGHSFLRLGQSTTLNANTISLGTGGRSNATMNLRSGLTGVPTVTVRGMDGVSPVTLWDLGRVANFNTTTWTATVDLSGAMLDAKVSTLRIASINTLGAADRRGTQVGNFTMGRGVLEVGSLVIGNYAGAGSANGGYTANGTFTLGHADGLVRAGSVILANNTGTTGGNGAKTVIGRFNLNAGTLEAATITRGTGGNAGTVTPQFNFSGGTVRNAVGQNLAISNVPIILTGAGTRIFEATANQTITVASNAVISGSGLGFTKAGDGTMIINSNSTYTGLTTVSAGTLLVNGTSSGAFSVASGATLGGTGTINGNLTLGGDSLFWITDLDSPLTMGGGATLSFTGDGGGFGIDRLANIDWETILEGTYTLVSGDVDFTNIRNVGLSNAHLLDSGYSAYFQEGSLQLVVTPVPEPSTIAILAAGAGFLGLRATRRRRAG